MTGTALIFQMGPVLILLGPPGFILDKAGPNPAFWFVAFCSACLGGLYYTAFFKALVRQRERFYQRKLKPLLSREYREK
jgi:drug/metabolite transporter (DMT)-like permease